MKGVQARIDPKTRRRRIRRGDVPPHLVQNEKKKKKKKKKENRDGYEESFIHIRFYCKLLC